MPFQKGVVTNPKGRPVGSTSYKAMVQQTFLEIMESKVKVGKAVVPYYQAFLETLKMSALDPSSKAFTFLAERLLTENVLDEIDTRLNRSKREDADFLTYRIVKSCSDIQQKILLSTSRKKYLMAGRRAGKTEANKKLAVQTAVSKGTSKILFITITFESCIKLYFNAFVDECLSLGWEPVTASRSDGYIKLENGSEVYFKGNSTQDDREKLRGFQWDIVVIDEVQSQKALPYLLNDIIEPTLIDRKGQLVLSGTGPRVRGTHWEQLWLSDQNALKLNWNLRDNPFIPDHETVLDQIKEEKGLTDSSPLFQREYLGKLSYDEDALVYRLGPDNWIKDVGLWIQSQPVTDIHFSGGIDYGFNDADGAAIVMFSDTKPEIFLVYEYKARRTGVTELVEACRAGIKYIEDTFPQIYDKHFYYYADTGGAGKKISFELATQYGLPVLDAYKANKDFAIELLQEQVRKGTFKVKETGIFADESLKTVFQRNDRDELTRTIDDDTYHPDLLDAVLYSLRPITLFSTQNNT